MQGLEIGKENVNECLNKRYPMDSDKLKGRLSSASGI